MVVKVTNNCRSKSVSQPKQSCIMLYCECRSFFNRMWFISWFKLKLLCSSFSLFSDVLFLSGDETQNCDIYGNSFGDGSSSFATKQDFRFSSFLISSQSTVTIYKSGLDPSLVDKQRRGVGTGEGWGARGRDGQREDLGQLYGTPCQGQDINQFFQHQCVDGVSWSSVC